ncbi:class V aminotransferase [Thraustotheca clavata]|uniref:cysteine desulfurase n=1 Tax=Thraustotheca clavata TaxID=74557 RepID=A0A1V9ZI76_9STRA|nr:class V aminotransferase [Thraustotheca clavata]
MIYLDYNATTPVDKQVIAALTQCLESTYGNPSSSHKLGQAAKAALETSRNQVASLLHCPSDAILFLSGGTESINYVLKGMLNSSLKQRHIITSVIEHIAVLDTCKFLQEEHGFDVTYVPVNAHGCIDINDVIAAIRPSTCLITIMHANNEVGAIQPIGEMAIAARNRHKELIAKESTTTFDPLLIHTDSSQSVGKIPVHVDALYVDFVTVAGHKLYAPKGIGALYIRPGTRTLQKFMHGAGHEKGLRAGTENIPYAVALGTACAMAQDFLENENGQNKLWSLRETLLKHLEDKLSDVDMAINGPKIENHVLPNTLSIGFRNVQAAPLLRLIEDRVAASAGSACHSNATSISAVLKAMKVDPEYAMGTLRLSVGKYTTKEELEKASEIIANAIHQQLNKRQRIK